MIFDTLIQTGDWKGEKHVPVITAPESFSKTSKEIRFSIVDAMGPNFGALYFLDKLFSIEDGKKLLLSWRLPLLLMEK